MRWRAIREKTTTEEAVTRNSYELSRRKSCGHCPASVIVVPYLLSHRRSMMSKMHMPFNETRIWTCPINLNEMAATIYLVVDGVIDHEEEEEEERHRCTFR
jgi:hypothetical protein